MNRSSLKDFLEEKVDLYNRSTFIESDPISIPHSFTKKEDIEISAFITALIAWGQRKSIIKNGFYFMQLMQNDPFLFVKDASEKELNSLLKFVHRTFNGIDARELILALREIYQEENGFEKLFSLGENQMERIELIHMHFDFLFQNDRTIKHISSPAKGSAAKRINMFLRWMVRQDNRKVDFGIWNSIPMSQLICPLDVHSGNVGRKLGLLNRTQNDWQAAEELTSSLRSMDANDPVKYDFALFGLGVFEHF